MRKVKMIALTAVLSCLTFTVSCKKDKKGEVTANTEVHDHDEETIPIDKSQFDAFFAKYPEFKEYREDINKLYTEHNHYVWHEKRGLIEFAEVLFNRVNQLPVTEGVPNKMPYKEKLNDLFYNSGRGDEPDVESELLISSMYFYYTKKALEGLDASKSRQTGWYLPRDKMDYVAYLDTLMQDPKLIKEDKAENYKQYYNLRKGLQKYRNIEKKGGWGTITLGEGVKSLKEGDSAAAVAQLRTRLYKEGYLKSDSKKAVFDSELTNALKLYEEKHDREYDGKVTADLIKDLNIPVRERIRAIVVNMERCRWLPSELNDSKEHIMVNIPSYMLEYTRDGKPFLTSNVVVGKELNKTVVFSGDISYLVFAPYWNVPNSILKNEIQPAIAKNPNYLAQNDMEWHGERVRQRPGPKNALGKVKFMFPNSNNIYLHDTPAKSLFNRDERAFSHGCVRVEKAHDLAVAIMKKDAGWSESKTEAAMNRGSESSQPLKQKIPVYITYFTAWADEDGNVSFYEDVYNRDDRLAHLLYTSK